jgi:hypothetical protein
VTSDRMPTSGREFNELKAKLWKFMIEDIYPNEQRFLSECKHIGESGSNEWTHAPIRTLFPRFSFKHYIQSSHTQWWS